MVSINYVGSDLMSSFHCGGQLEAVTCGSAATRKESMTVVTFQHYTFSIDERRKKDKRKIKINYFKIIFHNFDQFSLSFLLSSLLFSEAS